MSCYSHLLQYEKLRSQAAGMKEKYEERIGELENEKEELESEKEAVQEKIQSLQKELANKGVSTQGSAAPSTDIALEVINTNKVLDICVALEIISTDITLTEINTDKVLDIVFKVMQCEYWWIHEGDKYLYIALEVICTDIALEVHVIHSKVQTLV